jgi:pimeloyl-ACP methyl ester carboxylesterase
VEFARSDLGATKITLAGLRMGANLAAQLVRKRPDLARLVLWEPILDGKQYVAQNLRRSLVKAMLTSGEQFQAQKVTEAHAQAVVDFDGYLVRAEARAQLEALKLGDATVPFDGPALLVSIGPKDEPSEAIRRAAACFPKGEARGLRLEPFWNRIGLMDAGPLAKLTVEWLLA